jgi:hypothetical protein
VSVTVPAQVGDHGTLASALSPPCLPHALPGAAKADHALRMEMQTTPCTHARGSVQGARVSACGHALAGSFLASASAAAFFFSASRSAIFFFSRSASSANSSLAALSFERTPCARAACGQLHRADALPRSPCHQLTPHKVLISVPG